MCCLIHGDLHLVARVPASTAILWSVLCGFQSHVFFPGCTRATGQGWDGVHSHDSVWNACLRKGSIFKIKNFLKVLFHFFTKKGTYNYQYAYLKAVKNSILNSSQKFLIFYRKCHFISENVCLR